MVLQLEQLHLFKLSVVYQKQSGFGWLWLRDRGALHGQRLNAERRQSIEVHSVAAAVFCASTSGSGTG